MNVPIPCLFATRQFCEKPKDISSPLMHKGSLTSSTRSYNTHFPKIRRRSRQLYCLVAVPTESFNIVALNALTTLPHLTYMSGLTTLLLHRACRNITSVFFPCLLFFRDRGSLMDV